MKLANKNIGICIPKLPENKQPLLEQINKLSSKYKNTIFPIIDNYNLYLRNKDYRNYLEKIELISSKKILNSLTLAENLGKKNILDIILILPCSENIIPKLSYNIYNTPTMKILKYQMVNDKPSVLAIDASDGLSSNAENIGKLLNRKNYYFIPFKQTNPITKPYTISFEYSYILKTLEYAINKEQIQPILLSL